MKSKKDSPKSFLHEVAKMILGLLSFGLLIGFFLADHFHGAWSLAGIFLIFFGGTAKLMQYVLKTGQEPAEQEIPWAERVRQGLEPLEGSEDPKPEDLPWAERVRRGMEPLEGSEDPKPEELPWAERVRLGMEKPNLEEVPPAETHDHIPSTALEKDEKLEQLKVLLGAGLIDREEYEQKKRKLKREP